MRIYFAKLIGICLQIMFKKKEGNLQYYDVIKYSLIRNNININNKIGKS